MNSAAAVTQPDEVRTPCDDDVALVQAAKDGSIIAFEELVKRHERFMFRIAHNLLHNREDAQDTVQEAFFKAFQKLEQFQARSKFSTWLARITVNKALTKLRRDPIYRSSIEDDLDDDAAIAPIEIADWGPNPEMLYNASELRQILEENLQRLWPSLRGAFLLHDVEGLSLEETAQCLALSVAAVKSRSMRARLQLREWLNRYFRSGQQSAARPNEVGREA
jgi:RNA polymerase sigma-70 factor (ECF subfamily)